MELAFETLALWYPQPIVAFEGEQLTWRNHKAALSFEDTHTLPQLLGEEVTAQLLSAVAKRQKEWSKTIFLSLGMSEVILIRQDKKLYLEIQTGKTPQSEEDLFANLLANAGELMVEPLSALQLALDNMEAALGRSPAPTEDTCQLPVGQLSAADTLPHKLIPFSMETEQDDSKSESKDPVLQSIAKIRKSYHQLILISRNQTILADADGSLDFIDFDCYDIVRYMRELTEKVNILCNNQPCVFSVQTEAAVLYCSLPATHLRRVVMSLITLLIQEIKLQADKAGNRDTVFMLTADKDTIYLKAPLKLMVFPKLSGTEIVRRNAGTARLFHHWLRLTMMERVLKKYGGALLLDEDALSYGVTVTLPRSDQLLGIVKSPGGEEDLDLVYLAEVLDDCVYLQEW